METSGDEKVVSSLGWAEAAYNPPHRVPRKAFACTHYNSNGKHKLPHNRPQNLQVLFAQPNKICK